jgi:DNA-binding NtrC family response regulator
LTISFCFWGIFLKKSILVVDDDKSILRVLWRVLFKNGYEVDTAETAMEALDKLRIRHYDLALIDVILPDMKGTDMLAKAKEELKSTVKFIITGYPTAEVGAKARDYGADAFILKPVKIPELISIIHTFLNDGEENPYADQQEEGKFSLSEVNSNLAR